MKDSFRLEKNMGMELNHLRIKGLIWEILWRIIDTVKGNYI